MRRRQPLVSSWIHHHTLVGRNETGNEQDYPSEEASWMARSWRRRGDRRQLVAVTTTTMMMMLLVLLVGGGSWLELRVRSRAGPSRRRIHPPPPENNSLLLRLTMMMMSSEHSSWTTTPPPNRASSSSATLSSTRAAATPAPTTTTAIPHILYFIHTQQDILRTQSPPLFDQNIRHTIRLYEQAWNQSHRLHLPALHPQHNLTDHHLTPSPLLLPYASPEDNSPDTFPVYFLMDDECQALLQQVEPRLLRFYRQYYHLGSFQADLCRVAALFRTGGYYFDVDMKTLQAWSLDHSDGRSSCTLGTAYARLATPPLLQNSILASTPQHAVLGQALIAMLDYFQQQEHEEIQQRRREKEEKESLGNQSAAARPFPQVEIKLMGPTTLLTAYQHYALERLGLIENQANDTHGTAHSLLVSYDAALQRYHVRRHLPDHHQVPAYLPILPRIILENEGVSSWLHAAQTAQAVGLCLLDEINLQEPSLQSWYPTLPRQWGLGGGCNFVMHDAETQKVYFFTRFVGAGSYCFPPASQVSSSLKQGSTLTVGHRVISSPLRRPLV